VQFVNDVQESGKKLNTSPLAHLISPAGGTRASTPFVAGGTTGTSTPCPEAENLTPLKVLPAVINMLPNLEHHLAESLQ
jgi:hypothetical protein